MQPPNFRESARRHLHDSEILSAESRLANADHIVGFAAECGLKEIIISHLGGSIQNGFAVRPSDNSQIREHVGNKLWQEVINLAQSNNIAEIINLSQYNCFGNWSPSDRYAEGSAVTNGQLQEHTNAAKEVIKVLQALDLNNLGDNIGGQN